MNITKKILALIVASLMLLSTIPAFAAGESADQIAAAIDLSMLTDEDARLITKDLDLDLSEEYPHAVINWKSSNPDVLTIAGNKGKITRPEESTSVTLTASVYAGGETATKDIDLTVLIRNSVVLTHEDFESPSLPANTSIATIDELKNKGIIIEADGDYFSSKIVEDPENAENKVMILNNHTPHETGGNHGGSLDLTAAPAGTKRWIVSMDIKFVGETNSGQLFQYLYGNFTKNETTGSNYQLSSASNNGYTYSGTPQANHNLSGNASAWITLTYDFDVETMEYTVTSKLRGSDTVATQAIVDFSSGNKIKFENLTKIAIQNYRKVASSTYIDNIEIQAIKDEALSKEENASGEIVNDMLATQNGDNIAIRSSYSDSDDLVYVFNNAFENTGVRDNALSLKKAGLIPSDQGNTFNIANENIFSETEMGAPTVDINGVKMGAGIGAKVAVNVAKANHGLSTRDLGLVFNDNSSTEWTLVSIPDEDNLVFISENGGENDYKWSFADAIVGSLSGDYTITPEDQDRCELYPTSIRKSLTTKVYSEGALAGTLENGKVINGDSVEIKEEYVIVNPVSVARELTDNRPADGYSAVPSLDGLEELVQVTLTYTFDKNGRVVLKSSHKVLVEIPSGDKLNDIFDSFSYNAMEVGAKLGEAANKKVNSNTVTNGSDTFTAVLLPEFDGYNRYLDTNAVGFKLLDGTAIPLSRMPSFIPASAFPQAGADTTINSVSAWEFKEYNGDSGKFVIDYADSTYLFFDFSYASSFTHELGAADDRILNTLSNVGDVEINDTTTGDTRCITVTGDSTDSLILKLGSAGKTQIDEAREFFDQYGETIGVDVEDEDYINAQSEIITSFIADMQEDNSWIQNQDDIRDALLSWQAVSAFRGLSVSEVDAKILKYGENPRIGITNAQYSADVERYNSTEIAMAFRNCDSAKIAKPSDIKDIYDARIIILENREGSGEESASTIAEAIDIEAISDEDARYITKDLDLDFSEEYPHAVINWRSSNPDVLTIVGNKGKITGPSENTPVTLTAIIQAGGDVVEKDIDLTVLIRNSVILMQEDFNNPSLPANTSIANIDAIKNKGINIEADNAYFTSAIVDDPENANNKVMKLNLHTANPNGNKNYGGDISLADSRANAKRWIVTMDMMVDGGDAFTQFQYLYGEFLKSGPNDSNYSLATITKTDYTFAGKPADIKYNVSGGAHWVTIRYDFDIEKMVYRVTIMPRGTTTPVKDEYLDFSKNNTIKFKNLSKLSILNYRKNALASYVDNIEVQAIAYDSLNEKQTESGEFEKDMLVTQNGDKMAVRSSYSDSEDLVYVFDNLFENTNLYDNALSLKKAGIIPSAQGNTFDIANEQIFSATEIGAPTFTINGHKMGAGIGADVAVNVVKENHGLSTRDLGLVFTDASSMQWTLVSIPDKDNLVFVSENSGASDYKWVFATTIDGALSGEYNITPESQSVCELYPTSVRKSLTTKVSSKNAAGNTVVNTFDGETNLNGETVEIKEEYVIINPVSVARELTANRPANGYSAVPSLSNLEELVKVTLTYTFDKNGRVVLKSSHKVLVDVPLGDDLNDIFDSFDYNALEVGAKLGAATNKNVNSNTVTNGTDTFTAVLVPELDSYGVYLDTNANGFKLLNGTTIPQNRMPSFIPASAFPQATADTTINSVAAWEFKKYDGDSGKFVIDYADGTYLYFDFSYKTTFTHDVPSTDTRGLNIVSNVGDATVSEVTSGDTRTITATGDSGDTLIVKLGSPAKTDVDKAREFFEQYGEELGVDVLDTDYTAAQNEILTTFVADMYADNSWVQAPNDIKNALLSWQAVTAFRGLAVSEADAKILKYGENPRIGITNAQYNSDAQKYDATEVGKAFRELDNTKVAKPSDIKAIYDARILALKNQTDDEEDTTDEDVPTIGDVTINLGGGFGGGGSSDDKDDKKEEEKEEIPAPSVSYKDLATTHWAYDYISKLNEKNVINGYEDGTVRPEESVTREQLVKMIVTALALQAADTDVSFKDVPSGHWSEGYIINAASNGIISGYEDGGFKPQDKVTREDMAVIIKRALDKVGVSLKTDNEAVKFADSELIASYAKDSVDAVSAFGIISGMGDNSFNPKGLLTRAQAAKVIYLVCEAK